MAQTEEEVLIEGRLYNIKGFKHPGGSILKYHAGHGDASNAFKEFHFRSRKARKVLETLPNRPAPEVPSSVLLERQAKLSAEFTAFRQRLEKEGWFHPDYVHVAYRIAELVLIHVVGVFLVLHGYIFAGLALLGLGQGRCGWLMHEGGHHSMTGIPKVDRFFQEFFYGIGCGMSGGWWRVQHNKHHAAPQKLHRDVDLDTLPLVAFNKAVALLGKNNFFVRNWVPLQGYLFAPFTCLLVTFSWQFYLHPRFISRTKNYREMLMLVLRYAFIVGLARHMQLTFGAVALGYTFYCVVAGTYIFVNFALSHTHLPVTRPDEVIHWLEYASKFTINITPNLMTNWWMSYLNFQIEHHLFPSMPQYRFVKLSPQVRALFERNGLKYDCRGYWEAMADTFANLHQVGASLK